jgi:hypothetical protein
MCPPIGAAAHHYHFRLYALDSVLGAAAGSTKSSVEAAMSGHHSDETDLGGHVWAMTGTADFADFTDGLRAVRAQRRGAVAAYVCDGVPRLSFVLSLSKSRTQFDKLRRTGASTSTPPNWRRL